ncbi:mandelate racemase/muconate lactonizing protein [Candidatus Bathyarchaeota archaeon]|mgnify:CR=1 FL=1|nr:MAG: mandelate racemase/muconate lactonizing protein [Candidatus Bathyarchaeota archaeon]
MIIKDLRTFTLRSGPIVPKGFWEERLVRPVDIYERFRDEGPYQLGEEKTFEQIFLEVIVENRDERGIFGPISARTARIIKESLKPMILGEDPFSVEKIWDIMYRSQIHGRKGETIIAISAVDCALWDFIGKFRKEPVVRLLGGPVQEKVPAYASMLGFSVKPEDAARRSQEFVDKGFKALKWFFRYGPGSGLKGFEENINLVKAIRDAIGYDIELMLDCWNSWTINYAVKMARKLERYEPAWLEEPLMPDDIEGYVVLRKKVEIPIAGGEHEYTRWGARELLKRGAVDILQMDVTWAGGITEMRKICALASAEGIPVIPHAGWTEPAQSVIFSQPKTVCPIIEYLVKHSVIQQAFNKEKLKPEDGYFYAPRKIGLGFEPQMDKIIKEE